MTKENKTSIEEKLIQAATNIIGLRERALKKSKVEEIHFNTAKELIIGYGLLRKRVKNMDKKQLDSYDAEVEKSKRYFEIV